MNAPTWNLLRERMRSVTRGNKTGMLWLLKFGGVLVVFLVFFYPVQRELGVISANMRSMKEQTEGMKKISINLLTPPELESTQNRLKEFSQRLAGISQASALLDLISKEAEENHLNIIQIYSDSPVTAKGEHAKELELDGKKLFWIPVNFRVETDFKNLGNFLKSLSDHSKWEYVVESMQLQKSPQGDSLQCDLTLNFMAN